MTFEEWAVENIGPTQSAYMAAKKAWEARGKYPQDQVAQQGGAIRSACHVRPDQPPLPLPLQDDPECDQSRRC